MKSIFTVALALAAAIAHSASANAEERCPGEQAWYVASWQPAGVGRVKLKMSALKNEEHGYASRTVEKSAVEAKALGEPLSGIGSRVYCGNSPDEALRRYLTQQKQ